MIGGTLSDRDRQRLVGVDARLVSVVSLARESFSFFVIEGLRTEARQRELVAAKKSMTMQSKHLRGWAVDLAPWNDKDQDRTIDAGEVDWNDIPSFRAMATTLRIAADQLGVSIRWGGTFRTATGRPWFDGPHFELYGPQFGD